MNQKLCTKCGEMKLLDDLVKDKGRKDGRRSVCKECTKIVKRTWRQRNRDKVVETSKKWAESHQDKIFKSKKKWHTQHPEKVKIAQNRWNLNNLDKFRSIQRNASAKRRELTKVAILFSNADMELLKMIYLNCPKGYHVDHITPLSKGGKHHPDNLQYLPAVINLKKNTSLDYDYSGYAIRWQTALSEALD